MTATDEETKRIRAFLLRVRYGSHPLDKAPMSITGAEINARAADNNQWCDVCGAAAPCAYVADTYVGPRWLDLCRAHAYVVRLVNSGLVPS